MSNRLVWAKHRERASKARHESKTEKAKDNEEARESEYEKGC